ncbi:MULTISPECIES: hypothetical protein [Protofrankia]|uniref:hypothetical protein n=1 Tax=Protofrankia TaxID=2994361 RepID=UPI000977CEBF|nr:MULTISPECIES: hypothetical protein [Protofrankia]ONH35682.1 hypothetical protein BL254_10340 [Protofrankia sp. BMG5.30]
MTRRLPDETTRHLVARIGGNARVRQAESPAAMTAPARAAFLARFERQVDPDGVLPDDVRAAKAKAALSEQMARVSLARVRRAREARQERAEEPPPTSAPVSMGPSGAGSIPASWTEFLASRDLGVADDVAE